MKSLTFRPTEEIRALLEAELKSRPGVSQTYVLNEKLGQAFGRKGLVPRRARTAKAQALPSNG